MKKKDFKTAFEQCSVPVVITLCAVMILSSGDGSTDKIKGIPTINPGKDAIETITLSSETPADVMYKAKITGATDGFVNLRIRPSAADDSDVVGKANEGDEIYVLQEFSIGDGTEWAEIRLADNTSGYVNKKFIQKI